MRLIRRAAGLLACAVVAVTCTDAPTRPGSEHGAATSARLGVSPVFSPTASRAYGALASMGIVVTQVHVALTAADGRLALDTTVQFPADQDVLTMTLPVEIAGSAQTFTALFALLDASGMKLFAQTQAVTARAAGLPGEPPTVLTLEYVGPGFTARTLSLAPSAATLLAGTTTTITATGSDSAGQTLPQLLLTWRSSDTTIATVTGTAATAVLVGTGRRGLVTITATVPTGVTAQAQLTITPLAARLTALSGDAQTDSVGRALAQPFAVQVTDDFGVAVAGAMVTWTKLAGAGALAAAVSTTDAGGVARDGYTLGTTIGRDSVRASLGSTPAAPTTFFTARAISLSAKTISALSGGGQSATVLTALPNMLVAQVRDSLGNPVAGASVTWRAPTAASVAFAPTTSMTGADGLARTTATFGATAGVIRMTADLGGQSAPYDATATPGPATMLLAVTPHPDTITVDVPLPAPVQVRLVDAHGNLVRTSGVTVRAVRTGMTTSAAFAGSVLTDTAGIASISIPPYRGLIGQLALTLAANGLDSLMKPVTVLTGAPAQLGFVSGWPGANATAAGVAFAPQPVLQLYDVGGNPTPVANATVTATVASGATSTPAPVLGGASGLTDATGRATFSGLSISGTAGTYTLQFAAATYKAAVLSGNVSIVAGVAAKLTILTQPANALTGTGIVSPSPSVRLVDAYGNGVAGVQVSVSLLQPTTAILGGPLTPVVTDAQGVATFNGLTLVGVGLSPQLVFTTAVPSVPSVTSTPIPIL
jgi:hypothetical protein